MVYSVAVVRRVSFAFLPNNLEAVCQYFLCPLGTDLASVFVIHCSAVIGAPQKLFLHRRVDYNKRKWNRNLISAH